MRISGVYKLIFRDSDQFYIGSAKNIQKRFNGHKSLLNLKKHKNSNLQTLYNSNPYISFVIVERCPVNQLKAREDYYIKALNPPINICQSAYTTSGIHFNLSELTKSKMSAARSGVPRKYAVTIHKGGDHVNAKKVYCYQDSVLVKVYNALSETEADGFTFQNVHRAIKKGMRHKGFVWSYTPLSELMSP